MPPARSPLRPSVLIQTDKPLTSDDHDTDRHPSPSAPTWSPITPELKHASLGSVIQNRGQQQQQDGMPQPDSRIPNSSYTNVMQQTSEHGLAGHGRDEGPSSSIEGAANSKVTASEAMPPPPSPREREAAARAYQAQANHPHPSSSNIHSSPHAHPTPSSTITTNPSTYTHNTSAGPSSISTSIPQPQSSSQNPLPLLAQDPAPPPPPSTTKPIDLSSNTDALALKAAISILSLQRDQAVRDMQMLERQKGLALADPVGFARAVKGGKVRSRNLTSGLDFSYPENGDELDEKEEMDLDTHSESKADEQNNEADTSREGYEAEEEHDTRQQPPSLTTANFGHLPAPQNVVRAPPVNWRQYHIVGPALDALHDAQVRNPDEGRPRTDEDVRQAALRRMAARGEVPGRGAGSGGGKGAERVLMAPYDVFKDEIVKVKVDAERTAGGGLSGKEQEMSRMGMGGGIYGTGVKKEKDRETNMDKGKDKGKGKAKAKVGTPKRKKR